MIEADPTQKLAFAIVKQAKEDYQAAYAFLVQDPHSCAARAMLADCTSFFRSEWFNVLMDVDGESFLREVQKICRKEFGEIGKEKAPDVSGAAKEENQTLRDIA